jgi:hypothetical protein
MMQTDRYVLKHRRFEFSKDIRKIREGNNQTIPIVINPTKIMGCISS